MVNGRPRTLLTQTAITLVIAGGVLLSAGAARAGDRCGSGHRTISRFTPTASHSPGDAPDRPAPCTGPNCSLNRTPLVPLPPAPTTTPEPPPPEAILPDADTADGRCRPRVPLADHLPTAGYQAGVFHPPRR